MKDKLEIIKMIQIRFPRTHVGGSIGLFLHGIDLKRDLSKSDIDLTSPEVLDFSNPINIEDLEESSNTEDFDYSFRFYPNGFDGRYIKIEINVKAEKKFDVINYDGNDYNVSKKEDILFYKSSYAVNGVEKHIDDLITIATGVRPIREKKEVVAEIDDLPF